MRTPETVSTLNRLIRSCRDAEWSCQAWGRSATSAHLRSRYQHRSEEWARQGDELQALVLLLGGEPANAATVTTQAHCLWATCRTVIFGKSDSWAVEGSEQAQQQALSCYEQALAGYLPERIRRTVSLQAAKISARCDRMADPRVHFAAP